MKNNILRKGKFICCIFIMILLYACSDKNNIENNMKVDYTLSAGELAKSFYTNYIKSYEKDASVDELMEIEKNYMTETMVEELMIRSWEMEADAILGVQDGTGFLDKMEIEDISDDYSTVVKFIVPVDGQEFAKNTYEFHIHFRKVGDKKLIDTYDFIWIETDTDGDNSRIEYITKYANKEELTEDDKIRMSNQREYYEELFEEGYIG